MTASSEREKYHRHNRHDDEDGDGNRYNNNINSIHISNAKSSNPALGNDVNHSDEDDEEEDQSSARSARSSGLSSGSEGDISRSGSGSGDGSKSKNPNSRSSGGGTGGTTAAVMNKVSKRTGLRKGKWTVSVYNNKMCVFLVEIVSHCLFLYRCKINRCVVLAQKTYIRFSPNTHITQHSLSSSLSFIKHHKKQVEEEEYATRYIHYFSSGLLTLPEGTTLRASLADKLHCDPMRITKKYAGASCLGSKISRSLGSVGVGEKNNGGGRLYYTAEEVECAKMELRQLDARFQMRLLGSSGNGNGNGGAPLSPSNGGGNNNNNDYGSSTVLPPQSSMFDLSTYAGVRLAASNSGVSLLSKSSNSTRDGSKMMMMSASNATFPMSSTTTTTTTTTPTPQSLLASSYLATLAGNASLAGNNNDQSLTSVSGGNNSNASSPILNNNHLPQSQQPTMMMQGMNCGQANTSVNNNVTTAR
jgi:hypothetical protein